MMSNKLISKLFNFSNTSSSVFSESTEKKSKPFNQPSKQKNVLNNILSSNPNKKQNNLSHKTTSDSNLFSKNSIVEEKTLNQGGNHNNNVKELTRTLRNNPNKIFIFKQESGDRKNISFKSSESQDERKRVNQRDASIVGMENILEIKFDEHQKAHLHRLEIFNGQSVLAALGSFKISGFIDQSQVVEKKIYENKNTSSNPLSNDSFQATPGSLLEVNNNSNIGKTHGNHHSNANTKTRTEKWVEEQSGSSNNLQNSYLNIPNNNVQFQYKNQIRKSRKTPSNPLSNDPFQVTQKNLLEANKNLNIGKTQGNNHSSTETKTRTEKWVEAQIEEQKKEKLKRAEKPQI